MDRKTKLNVTIHKFSFKIDEIWHLGLLSHQFDYMEEAARKSLQDDGFEHLGGETRVCWGDGLIDTVLTIAIYQ